MKQPTYALRPIIPDNACILRITAAAGTELADAYSLGTVIIVPNKRGLQSTDLRPSVSVQTQSGAFATGVLPDIYAFHRYTGNSSYPYYTLATQFPSPFCG